jgi:hypothetical protein
MCEVNGHIFNCCAAAQGCQQRHLDVLHAWPSFYHVVLERWVVALLVERHDAKKNVPKTWMAVVVCTHSSGNPNCWCTDGVGGESFFGQDDL